MTEQKLSALNNEIEEFLSKRGAIKVGFATLETLAGGPPSTDLKYVLPEAKSAISYALLFDRKKIRDYLSKKVLLTMRGIDLLSILNQLKFQEHSLKCLRKKDLNQLLFYRTMNIERKYQVGN
ncbi:MAG: hypothetical protein HWN67_02345 [Candidatus Helarchaeota archaeon]|nr:hypothetical protein [Candidatus Helarchaeota archaeon]